MFEITLLVLCLSIAALSIVAIAATIDFLSKVLERIFGAGERPSQYQIFKSLREMHEGLNN